MKLWTAFLFAAVGLAQVGGLTELATPDTRANVAANAGFETGNGSPDDWSLSGGLTWTTDDARTGTHSVAHTGDTKGVLQQTTSAVSFRVARIRFWMKTSGAVPDSAVVAALFGCNTCGYAVHSGHEMHYSLAGGLADWTQFTYAENMSWGDEHFGHDLNIKIHPDDLGAATLYIDDVTVEPVIYPVMIFPMYPNYRGMLWPDQGTTMKWQAIVELPTGKSIENLEVWTELLDSEESLLTTIKDTSLEAVNTTGGAGAQWPGVSLNTQEYDASGLDNGTYYLRGKLIEKPSTLLYTYSKYKIIKEAAATQRDGWDVWVDKYNRTIIDGVPTFIWGAFLNPVYACNGSSGGSLTTAAQYKSINAGNSRTEPQFTWWNRSNADDGGTMLKLMADAGMNADIFFGNLAGGNIGIVNNGGATGTISSSGTAVTGVDTVFESQLAAGDVIDVSGIAGTGTISSYKLKVVGDGTSFLSEVKINDQITANGATERVTQVDSDTVLWVRTAFDNTVSAESFTIQAFREVASVTDDTHLTLENAFPANLSGDTFKRNLCAGYNSGYSNLLGWAEAAADFGIRHLHITVSYHAKDVNSAPTWTRVCAKRTSASAVDELLTHSHDGTYLGSHEGWLGTYIADEPDPDGPIEGRALSFSKARAAMDAIDPDTSKTFGGVNYWLDGLMPVMSANQWGNFMDAAGTDPYPWWGTGGVSSCNADDKVYDMHSGPKHARSYWWPRREQTWTFNSRPVWTTIQLFQPTVGDGIPPHSSRKIQLVSALAAGSTGIFWWTAIGASGMGCKADDDYYLGWQQDAKVIADVMPILATPIQDLTDRMDGEDELGRIIASVSDGDIHVASWQKGTRLLLALANTTGDDQEDVVFVLTEAAMPNATGTAVKLFDGGTVAITDARTFTLTFQGLQDVVTPEGAVYLLEVETQPAGSRRRAAN